MSAAIKRLENNLVWRRTLGLYDVEELAKEVEPEVSFDFLYLGSDLISKASVAV